MKIGMISLGCAKNTVDSEIMLGMLAGKGYEITNDITKARVLIVNTCGFIDSAKQEAIETIIECGRLKEEGICEKLIVTGCLAQRYSSEIKSQLPEVDVILGINGYDRIIDAVEGRIDFYNDMTLDIKYLEHDRVLTTPSNVAYVKISEGCDNRCSYCAIPYIRGSFRSRPIENIKAEVINLVNSGIKEIVIVAQDTSRYGVDLYLKPSLAQLMYELDSIKGDFWIRIMYLYPDEIADSLIDAFKNCSKVLHYVDLPVQHISDNILSRMNRRGNSELIYRIFREFKKKIPDCIIRTSLIVGFPGETKEDFEQLEQFVISIEFDHLGVFEYSKEEGTPAYSMKGQVDAKNKKSRYNRIMEIQQGISAKKNRQMIGKVVRVLTEGISDDGIFYYGRSYMQAPEVDGLIYFIAENEAIDLMNEDNMPVKIGDFVDVEIMIAEEYDMTGKIVYQRKKDPNEI